MKTVISRQLSIISFLALAIFALASLCFAQQQQQASIAEQASRVTEFDVNGLKVLVKRRASSPTVAGGLFIRGGARNINAANAGIENFMLEAATEGSKKYPRRILRRELSSTGSGVGSSSINDYSVLSFGSTRQSFNATWDIFTDVALNPTFAPADVEQARQAITAGLREQETSNDNYLQILQERAIYAGHPYANDINGTLETVSRLTPKDLSDYHRKIMQTAQLLLVVVGDVDPEDLRAKVAASFGELARGEYKDAPLPALDFSKPTLDVSERTLPTNYVRGVFSAPSLSSPDYPAMRVAVALLGSQVYEEVRIKRQLSYAPSAEIDSDATNTANIYVTAVDANQSVTVMLGEINNLRTRLVTPEIISVVAGNFLTKYYLDQETNGAQAGELARYELIGGGWRNSFQFLDKVRAVTPKEVQDAANKYMKNLRFVVVGDPQAVNKNIFLQQ